jgi:hypothetical protein
MVDPHKEKPLPLRSHCSDTFWEEESTAIPTLDLLHFTADIKGSHAAITIDKSSWWAFVSIEVVEKLQLRTYERDEPYMLATNDDALPITRHTYVPLTIYGHTDRVYCHVIPRAFNSCHLLLGKNFCKKYEVDCDTFPPDIGLLWNNKKEWLIYT